MHSIVRSFDISAPSEAVWAVLMDWSLYPTWNPFIREIVGKAKAGGEIKVRIRRQVFALR